MKKSVDVNDLLRQKEDMKTRTNKDPEYLKEYNRHQEHAIGRD